MNILPAQRTITEFHIALSEADAREAVDSPYIFADKLAEQLRAAGVMPTPSSNGKPGPKPRLESHTLREGGRPNGKGAHPKRQSAGGLAKVACPECGQEIAQKYLANHREKKHRVERQPAAVPQPG